MRCHATRCNSALIVNELSTVRLSHLIVIYPIICHLNYLIDLIYAILAVKFNLLKMLKLEICY